jgi:hypothetical protein
VIERWTSALTNTTNNVVNSFALLNQNQLNWKPNAGTWSIAQNLEHLIIINSTYFPILEALQTATYHVPLIGRIPFVVDYIGKFILRSVQPDRKKRMKTFAVWEPTSGDLSTDILQRFQVHHQLLKTKIIACQNLISCNPVISSPANRYVVYRLQTAFEIIIAHEQRHYVQAGELLPHLPAECLTSQPPSK